MSLRRRAAGVAATLLMTAGLTTAATGTAQAAEGCGGTQVGRHVGVKGDLRIFREGDNYCAIVYHTDAYWGVYLPTAVQIVRKDGALSPQDDGNYRYYAGPVRIATGGMFGYASAWVNGEHLIA
ncbi:MULTISPECIES: hypothetical protein [Streptomyces]|uniref:Secreted protein n=1 Tax=Streptomyces solicathayae TaxID=3081768 RepID=A0ABZ0LN47_9ACTN|nr:hypothetical protein [Streptomyces sp. HUAS YS2]WOX20661.1 hypothetical protein R2D22_04340 [Streptomyces sp. HUAS YS2]